MEAIQPLLNSNKENPFKAGHWILIMAFKQLIPFDGLSNSWHFSCYSAPIHWLVHGQMTSNNETVSHQMSRAGNIAKTVTVTDDAPHPEH